MLKQLAMSSAAALLCTWLQLHVVDCCFRRSVAVPGRYAIASAAPGYCHGAFIHVYCRRRCRARSSGSLPVTRTHYHVSGDMHMRLGVAPNAGPRGTQSCERGVELLLCNLVHPSSKHCRELPTRCAL